MLIHFFDRVRRFLKAEEGPTAVEYAVMMALIIVVCFIAVMSLGSSTNNNFTKIGTRMGGGGS
jgi:pilus assembly protein Flp/PilA